MGEMAWQESPEKEPGNFGDPLGLNLNVYNTDMRSKELNNGRMAMISVLGIFAAELATGKDAIEQFGLSATPRCQKSAFKCSVGFAGSTASRQPIGRGRASRAAETVAPAAADVAVASKEAEVA